MLTLAKEADRERIARFCAGSLLGAYLACRLRCYGFSFEFVRFWCEETDGELTAVIGALEDAAVLLAREGADLEELGAFLRMMPFSSVMTTPETAEGCGFSNVSKKTAFVYTGGAAVPPAERPEDMHAVYDLISNEIPGSFSREIVARLSFLSDFMFRKNRGASRAAGIFKDGTLCACALTAAETEDAAVLSGVACHRRFRGQGYGKQIVLSLANELQAEGKTVYVIALNDSAAGFYRNIGFADDQSLAIIERISYV